MWFWARFGTHKSVQFVPEWVLGVGWMNVSSVECETDTSDGIKRARMHSGRYRICIYIQHAGTHFTEDLNGV